MLPVRILQQPDDVTCGPTCLHAVYNYYGENVHLTRVISEVALMEDGGTLGVLLANSALKRGYHATIYTYNLHMFDPTWKSLGVGEIKQKLQQQSKYKKSKRLSFATEAYLEFFDRGGVLLYEDLSVDLMKRYFEQKTPILTGLSATYMYNCSRERTGPNNKSIMDDVQGTPMGHFVVLCGFDEAGRIVVADPYPDNPVSGQSYYSVDPQRLLHAILLGIVTYDANLLVLEPGKR